MEDDMTDRLTRALALIDAANAADPKRLAEPDAISICVPNDDSDRRSTVASTSSVLATCTLGASVRVSF